MEEANADYDIVGGYSDYTLCRSRLTQDIDIVVGNVDLDKLIKSLKD